MAGGGSSSSSFSAPPYQLIFIFLIVMLLWGFSSYLAYEDSLEETMDQLKLFLMISPVILLLAVRCFSGGRPMRHIGSLLPASEPDAIHRAGSSPWGVGLLVVLLLVMISYQSVFHDQWFPLLSRD